MNERFEKIQELLFNRHDENKSDLNEYAFGWFLETIYDKCRNEENMNIDDVLYYLEEAFDAADTQ